MRSPTASAHYVPNDEGDHDDRRRDGNDGDRRGGHDHTALLSLAPGGKTLAAIRPLRAEESVLPKTRHRGLWVASEPQAPLTRQLSLLACVRLGRLRLKLEAHERLFTHNLRLVAGFDHVRLARPDFNLGAVLVSDPHRSRLHNAQMC
jgi:hypothetical protein